MERLGQLLAHVDRAPMAALRGTEHPTEDGSLDPNLTLAEIHIVPPEGERFAQPEARASEQQEERIEPTLTCEGRGQEGLQLGAVERLNLLLPGHLGRRQAKLPSEPIG